MYEQNTREYPKIVANEKTNPLLLGAAICGAVFTLSVLVFAPWRYLGMLPLGYWMSSIVLPLLFGASFVVLTLTSAKKNMYLLIVPLGIRLLTSLIGFITPMSRVLLGFSNIASSISSIFYLLVMVALTVVFVISLTGQVKNPMLLPIVAFAVAGLFLILNLISSFLYMYVSFQNLLSALTGVLPYVGYGLLGLAMKESAAGGRSYANEPWNSGAPQRGYQNNASYQSGQTYQSNSTHQGGSTYQSGSTYQNNAAYQNNSANHGQASGAYQGNSNAPEELFDTKSIGICIVLSLITCGIYGLYWLFTIIKKIKLLNGEQPSCAGEFCLNIFIPFYAIYWVFTRAKKLSEAAGGRGIYIADNSVICLILNIFGFGIVSWALMQDGLNQVARHLASPNQAQSYSQSYAPNYASNQAPNYNQNYAANQAPSYNQNYTPSQAPSNAEPHREPAQPDAAPQAGGDAIEQLQKLAELKNQGVISEQEFEEKKKELLGRL